MAQIKMTGLEYCRSHPLNAQNIPDILKDLSRWVVWKAFDEKPDGRFAKVPICPRSGRKINHLDKGNQMPFEQALKAHKGGSGDGVGIVLTGEAINHDDTDEPLYLIGVDLDKVGGSDEKLNAAKSITQSIGSYAEISPSGTGIRIFALSKETVGHGQSPSGEMYHKGRFLTVTGRGRLREVVTATDQLKAIEHQWWPEKLVDIASTIAPKVDGTNDQMFNSVVNQNLWSEDVQNIAKLSELLAWIPPETDHETWRDIIWAVASLGWSCGRKLLVDWSKGDLNRWSTPEGASEAEEYLFRLYNVYDPYKNITIGTLFYHAERFGRPKGVFEQKSKLDSEQASTQKKFKILSRDGLKSLPPAEWLVQGILPTTGVATIYGPSMSGKSFIAIDLAIAITNGDATWFSKYLLKRPGLFVALEGGAGIKKRIEAWEKHHQRAALSLKYLLASFSLLDENDISELIIGIKSEVGKGAVIFIDTLSQATAGADENSSKDMGCILAAAQHISQQIEGLVVLIHHTGKDARKGARGHSSFHAAMEAAIEVSRKDNARFWKTAKVKDGDDTINEAFELQALKLGVDQYGHPETSCVIIPRSVNFTVVEPKGKNQLLALNAIKKALVSKGSMTDDEAQTVVKLALADVSTGHRAARAKEAIKSLAGGGHINISGETITLPKNTGSSP